MLTILLLMLTSPVFSKTKRIQFEDQTYTLYISPEKLLFIEGPWSEEPTYLDKDVDDVWYAVNLIQTALIVQKPDEIDWMALKRETGEITGRGKLQPLVMEDGTIAYCTVQIFPDKYLFKIVFDDGRFVVYDVDPAHQSKKIARRGKIPNFWKENN